jgi:single-strand DNA-binding protein
MANFNFNKTILGGKLTSDPELKTTPNGTAVTQFTIAVNRKGKDGAQSADFINCVAWRQTADFLGSYAQKGMLVGIDGKIQTRSYENRDGQKVYITEVLADSVQILETKKAAAPSSDRPRGTESYKTKDISTSPADIFNESDIEISSDDLPF